MPGCGKYAADSWAVFVEGRTDVEPDDGKLNWYIDRRRQDDNRDQQAADGTGVRLPDAASPGR
jgi:hypothetical protein